MNITSTQHNLSWDEADQLISILRTWGIDYLVGENHPSSSPIHRGRPIHRGTAMASDQQTAVRLIQRLAQCEYPRVRDASISLFLLHPELAPAVLEAIKMSELAVAEQITTLLLATLLAESGRSPFAPGRSSSAPITSPIQPPRYTPPASSARSVRPSRDTLRRIGAHSPHQ
jgi:YD repeat-containing protein